VGPFCQTAQLHVSLEGRSVHARAVRAYIAPDHNWRPESRVHCGITMSQFGDPGVRTDKFVESRDLIVYAARTIA